MEAIRNLGKTGMCLLYGCGICTRPVAADCFQVLVFA
jgi:hypothetical protein